MYNSMHATFLAQAPSDGVFDIVEVFKSCPIIYSILILMSIAATAVWLYSLATLRLNEMLPNDFLKKMRDFFNEKRYEAALSACEQEDSLGSRIIAAGIASRQHGAQLMVDAMRSEARRASNSLWQRVSLLNEIAVVAPMLGLLGTVVGLFFAFYNSGRSAESIASIFDGLGIAVGTTVVGLIVSILAMIFYTTLKFRVVQLMSTIETESLALVNLVDNQKNNNGNP